MPDKKREENFTKLFLDHYSHLTGKQYEIDCSPEDRNDISGTYDFLCKNKSSENDYLAVEEKSLRKSKENARDSNEICEIKKKTNTILDKKGIFYNKKYVFCLGFRRAPKDNEKDKYAEKIAELVEKTISDYRDTNASNKVIFSKIEGYDCLKEISLSTHNKGQKIEFMAYAESDFGGDISSEVSSELKRIIDNSNSKLEIPKNEGKKTILLVALAYASAVDDYVRDAIQCIGEEKHRYIDEIFFIRGKNFEEGFDIIKIKGGN